MGSDISVIICAYTEKRWHELTEAVASVQHQTVWPVEIITVIDYNPVLFQRTKERKHYANRTSLSFRC